MDSLAAPQVDPHSPHGHIVASRKFLEQHLGGRTSEILRGHFAGESMYGPKVYWFENTAEVRRELGMTSPNESDINTKERHETSS
jgi:hypothetical protein